MVSDSPPVRLCIATAPAFAEVEPVTEYAIRRNASVDVEIHWLRAGKHGLKPNGCTGFTMFRYAIAEIFGEGFAIYLDVDMLLVSDIAELWGYRKHGEWRCLQDGSTEVMVIDCAVRNGVPPIGQLMRLKKNQVHPKLNPAIPLEWNCEDSAPDGAKLIHFTDLKRQPWNVARNDDAAKVWHDCAAMCR